MERLVNSILLSNSYILYLEDKDCVFVIDPGDYKPILDWLTKNCKTVKGIFITHSHFDHIYGVNELQEKFPDIKVYTSCLTKEGMMSEKLNGSRYHDMPYIIKQHDLNILNEGDLNTPQ